jgi:FtsP/CotA-like multicopper oxidase with cupredoxin domain
VISTDGNMINKPTLIKNKLINVAPGERYDIEFKADNPGTWFIESHDKDTSAAKNMVEKIQYEGTNKQMDQRNYKSSLPLFDFTKYGKTVKKRIYFKSKIRC